MNSNDGSCPVQTTYGRLPRAELIHVLMLPDYERADRIGEFYGNVKTRTFAAC